MPRLWKHWNWPGNWDRHLVTLRRARSFIRFEFLPGQHEAFSGQCH
jgi:hypothetical protein